MVAVQTSVVVPTGKMEPDGGTQATVPQVPVTRREEEGHTAPAEVGVVPLLIGAGQASEQAWVQQTGSAVWKREAPAAGDVAEVPGSVVDHVQAPGAVGVDAVEVGEGGTVRRGRGRRREDVARAELVGRKVPETIVAGIAGAGVVEGEVDVDHVGAAARRRTSG